MTGYRCPQCRDASHNVEVPNGRWMDVGCGICGGEITSYPIEEVTRGPSITTILLAAIGTALVVIAAVIKAVRGFN